MVLGGVGVLVTPRPASVSSMLGAYVRKMTMIVCEDLLQCSRVASPLQLFTGAMSLCSCIC